MKDRIEVRAESASENFQLSTYGIGGDVQVHVDTYGKPELPQENYVDFEAGVTGFRQRWVWNLTLPQAFNNFKSYGQQL